MQLLNNLGLAQETTLNLAGLLIFGRRPQRHRPVFMVKAVSFVGNDPAGDKYRDSIVRARAAGKDATYRLNMIDDYLAYRPAKYYENALK